MRLVEKWWCECKNELVETDGFTDSISLRMRGGELKDRQFLVEVFNLQLSVFPWCKERQQIVELRAK